jgi:glycosyltransferase involved in cell wall biosynthesis
MISFIIPAHNEEALIAATVDAISECANRAGRPFEIIVACDACTDQTALIAGQNGARAIPVNNRQIAATRNSGAREAKGDIFIFVDADTILTEPALRDALSALDGGAVGGGGLVQLEGQVSFTGRFLMALFSFGYFKIKRLAAGCFIFARRDAFEKVGGFDERYYASEEIHLSQALKRCGKFVIVKSHVISSGRKLRMHSIGQILRLFGRLAWSGRRGLQKREGLEFWYDGRRETKPLDTIDKS